MSCGDIPLCGFTVYQVLGELVGAWFTVLTRTAPRGVPARWAAPAFVDDKVPAVSRTSELFRYLRACIKPSVAGKAFIMRVSGVVAPVAFGQIA